MSEWQSSIKSTDKVKTQLVELSKQAHESGHDTQATFLSRAYGNEHGIEMDVNQLQNTLWNARDEIDRALERIERDQVQCLNSCGILQSLNGNIDRQVIELQAKIAARGYYLHVVNI
ncbi:MAG TPA: hypothetical protein VMW24_15915 [Sedimentisphaerales bacterium]|nr:hypothetical protein [Sedimentisphaerales bacterium]